MRLFNFLPTFGIVEYLTYENYAAVFSHHLHGPVFVLIALTTLKIVITANRSINNSLSAHGYLSSRTVMIIQVRPGTVSGSHRSIVSLLLSVTVSGSA